jgi:hypothetical protein
MSENKLSNGLLKIEVPELNSPDYATKLNGIFDNIIKNFNILANKEFVKGETGESVEIKSIDLSLDNVEAKNYRNLIKRAIVDAADDETVDTINEDTSVGGIKLFDLFDANPGVLHLIVSKHDANEQNVVSSLYYVFHDARYNSPNIGKIDDSAYTNITDLSCILVYDNTSNDDSKSKFKKLSNAFPTLYYESGVGLCWKINGADTGLPVRGLTGRDGKNAILNIVKCDEINVSDKNQVSGIVSYIHDKYEGYITKDSFNADELESFDGQSAVILAPVTPITGNGPKNDFYFGYLKYDFENKKLYAYTNSMGAINIGMNKQIFINTMKSIGLDNTNTNSYLPGLFIPISEGNGTEQPVHLMTAAALNDFSNNIKNDIVLTPIDNVEDFKSVGDIRKYLYLKIDKNDPIYDQNFSNIIASDSAIHNFTFKYKLCNITNSEGLEEYRKFTSQTDIVDNIPHEFTQNPIYVWKISLISDDFDVDELKSIDGWINDTEYNYDNKLVENEYAPINYIFTTTANPGPSTKFMWYNDLYKVDENGLPIPSNSTSTTKYTQGWSNCIINPMLKFVKFISIYGNTKNNYGNASLNIDYDVNIIGNESNISKNLNVHGSIGTGKLYADNIHTKTLSADTIDNVNTPNKIIGNSGISIGVNEAFSVDKNGHIAAKQASIDSINTGNMTTSGIEIPYDDEINNLAIGIDNNDKKFKVSFNDVNSFNIKRKSIEHNKSDSNGIAATKDTIELEPKMINDVPTIYDNKSNIIVTNISPNNESYDKLCTELCYTGVPTTLEINNIDYEAGTGVASPGQTDKIMNRVADVEFDYVKNFNMHRLAVDGIDDKLSNSNVKSTTICNDGVVVRSGEYVFGLGHAQYVYDHARYGYKVIADGIDPIGMPLRGPFDYHWAENTDGYNYRNDVPVLFYHKYDDNYYRTYKNYGGTTDDLNNTMSGYARRINAIPLDELFEIIQEWRTFKSTDTYKEAMESIDNIKLPDNRN